MFAFPEQLPRTTPAICAHLMQQPACPPRVRAIRVLYTVKTVVQSLSRFSYPPVAASSEAEAMKAPAS
jgi:hypothetical protein